MFPPVDGQTKVAGGVIENGSYQVEVPPGEKIVQIRAVRLVADEFRDEIIGETIQTENPVRLTSEEYESRRSPLRATVTKSGEQFDFDLPKIEEKGSAALAAVDAARFGIPAAPVFVQPKKKKIKEGWLPGHSQAETVPG